VVRETSVATEMSVAFSAVLRNLRERARRAGHAAATSPIAGVHDVSCTRFVACFTHVPSNNGSSKICDYVMMQFDIVVEQIKSLDRVDLSLKHYVFTDQTVKGNYLYSEKCS